MGGEEALGWSGSSTVEVLVVGLDELVPVTWPSVWRSEPTGAERGSWAAAPVPGPQDEVVKGTASTSWQGREERMEG
jgi:hypothetical protein